MLIKDAGKQMIHIVDNGSGMHADDLQLSIKRHATSKIYSQEQLEAILTYGFRGEALASIASVAKIEIRTKQSNDSIGYRLISEPGNEAKVEQFNTPNGTQIFVRSLFFNTPARRKFLRSNITEFRHISESLMKFAIAHPDKRFTFYDDDNIIFDVKPENLSERIQNLIGRQVEDNLIPVDYIDETIEIKGFLGTPALSAKKSYGDYLFLNSRPIKSRSIAHAIFTATEHLLEKNSKPFYVLFLVVNPHQVDINVHPQKHEVKFENERLIYNSVLNAVSKALGAFNLFPMDTDALQVDNPFALVNTGGDEVVVNKITGEIIYDKSENRQTNNFYNSNSNVRTSNFSNNEANAYKKLFEDFDNLNIARQFQLQVPAISELTKISNGIYQINADKYLIYIDIVNSHQRILYEIALNADKKRIPRQELLFPTEIDNFEVVTNIKSLNGILNKFGYEYELLPEKVMLKTVPSINGVASKTEAFIKIASSEAILHGNSNLESLARKFAEENAFHRNDNISLEQCIYVIEQLLLCRTPQISPMGRKNYFYVEKKSIISNFF